MNTKEIKTLLAEQNYSNPAYLTLLLSEGGPPKDGGVGSGNWKRPDKSKNYVINDLFAKIKEKDETLRGKRGTSSDTSSPPKAAGNVPSLPKNGSLTEEEVKYALEENKKVYAYDSQGKLDISKIPGYQQDKDYKNDSSEQKMERNWFNRQLLHEQFRQRLEKEFNTRKTIPDITKEFDYDKYAEGLGLSPNKAENIRGFYDSESHKILLNPLSLALDKSEREEESHYDIHESIHAKDPNNSKAWELAIKMNKASDSRDTGWYEMDKANYLKEGMTELLARKLHLEINGQAIYAGSYSSNCSTMLVELLEKHDGDRDKIHKDLKGALEAKYPEYLSEFTKDFYYFGKSTTKSNQAWFRNTVSNLLEVSSLKSLHPAIETYLKENPEDAEWDNKMPPSINSEFARALGKYWLIGE